MPPLTPDIIWKVLQYGGPYVAWVIAFLVGWIVPRWVYNELRDRCEKLTTICQEMTDLAKKNTAAADELRLQKLALEKQLEYERSSKRRS